MLSDKSNKLMEYFLREEKVYLGVIRNLVFRFYYNINEVSRCLKYFLEIFIVG